MVGRINLRPDEGPVGCEAKEQGFHQTMMLTRATTGKGLRCGQRRYEFTCELNLNLTTMLVSVSNLAGGHSHGQRLPPEGGSEGDHGCRGSRIVSRLVCWVIP
jgi:hypothetical protein